jgi:hypothetical protein
MNARHVSASPARPRSAGVNNQQDVAVSLKVGPGAEDAYDAPDAAHGEGVAASFLRSGVIACRRVLMECWSRSSSTCCTRSNNSRPIKAGCLPACSTPRYGTTPR